MILKGSRNRFGGNGNLLAGQHHHIITIMALHYMPCVGGEHIQLRSGASFPWSSGYIDKCSGFPCTTTSTWSINVKRHHFRRHRRGIPLPFQINLKQVTKILQAPLTLVPAASLAQSSRSSVESEERSSGALLTFSYATPVLRGEDEDADGGRAYDSSSDVDFQEQLRREKIAEANKGKVPWNKGRRHSPETIAKIRERTKLAMLNPEVRDKLRHFGKNQTPETKMKIRNKLIGYWEGKRVIREAQAICVREWKEAIAEAARVGGPEDEELEWDSYKKIKEQYKLEEKRAESRERARLKTGRKRKPVSDAHRKAISDAIRAKWADPEYQARVSAGTAHRRRKSPSLPRVSASNTYKTKVAPKKVLENTVVIVEKPAVEKKKALHALQALHVDEDFIAEVLAEEVTHLKRSERSTAARLKGPQKVTLVSLEDHNLPSGEDSEAVEKSLVESDVRTPARGSEDVHLSSKLSTQSYKDPFLLEKVERIEQLRKGRLEVELKRKEAADRARMLIANAERAAAALEQSGNADAAALATLREARRVLAEATRSVQAAELKPGSSLDKLMLTRSAKSKENKQAVSGMRTSDFHSRLWTEGNNLENCPHPIPMRMRKVPSREEQELGGVSRSSSSKSFGWASQSKTANDQVWEDYSVSQATGSEEQNEEAVQSEEFRNPAACGTHWHGQRSSKNATSGSKKRWHRGRLVTMNEDERT